MSAFKTQLKGLKELRFHFCQSAYGDGLRNFVLKNYIGLREANPELRILIREADGIDSRVFARFDKGVERKATLTNASAEQIEKTLAKLVKSA